MQNEDTTPDKQTPEQNQQAEEGKKLLTEMMVSLGNKMSKNPKMAELMEKAMEEMEKEEKK